MFHLATFYGYFWPTLYNRNEKSKILKWFEEIFVQVSGEKQLLQLDEFKKALYTNGVSNIWLYSVAKRLRASTIGISYTLIGGLCI